MDMRFEALVLPVEDVDRAKEFYARAGFTCDVDHDAEGFRVVQFTPPGSACSIIFGTGLGDVSAAPVVGLHLVVTDLERAVTELRERDIEVADPFHYGPSGPTAGVDPNHADYNSYAAFTDPDDNKWLLQEVPSRSQA